MSKEVKLTKTHKLYELALRDKAMWPVLATGSAGTGKTFTAIGFAVEWLQRGKNQRVKIIRPNVSFTKSLGFLAGGLREKLQPWVAPLEQAFVAQGLAKTQLQLLEKRGALEYICLEHIQGLSFDNSLVIIDECANMSFSELKMIFTRMGRYSKLVLCGDTAQTAKGIDSGLGELMDMVDSLNLNCHTISFTTDDIVRSEQCKQWLRAFDTWSGEGS